MATNRPRSLIRRQAGTGLTQGSGTTLDVDFSELTPKTAPVMADSFAIVDSEDSDASKVASLTNVQKALGEAAAGTNATSGLSETDGVLRVNINGTTEKAAPVAADAVMVNDSADSNKNKRATLTNMQKALGEIFAGTNATSGLSEVDGVGRVNINGVDAKTPLVAADAILVNDSENSNINKKATLTTLAALMGAIAQMPADLKSSLFITALEFDASTTLAVDTKLSDSLEAKGQLLFVLGVVTELFNGTADSDVIISKAALGATPMASTIVMDKDSTQLVGSVVGAWPVSGADSIQAAEGDVYAYVSTDDSRSTGKIGFLLLWMKTA